MMEEEMEECKGNEHKFLKKIYKENSAAAIKVLKVTKMWKLLIYLMNEKTMQQVINMRLAKGFYGILDSTKLLLGMTTEVENSKE